MRTLELYIEEVKRFEMSSAMKKTLEEYLSPKKVVPLINGVRVENGTVWYDIFHRKGKGTFRMYCFHSDTTGKVYYSTYEGIRLEAIKDFFKEKE